MHLSPQQSGYSRKSKSCRIKKSPSWDDEEGVAATVGTIMALMVFLAFMGLFTNQFVPVWMSDNESTHMAAVIQQFSTLKSEIDSLISSSANSLLAPTPIFIPITLSAPGIPIFAGPTAGVIRFNTEWVSGKPSFNVSYASTSFNLDSSNGGHCGGGLELYCPNRYYVEQYLEYENGAVIVNQTDGEYIIAGIQMSIQAYSGTQTGYVVKLTQISLFGQNRTIGGTGSKGVNADLLYASTNTYSNTGGTPLTITIRSAHGVAWERYFNKSMNSSYLGLKYGTDYSIHRVLYTLPGYQNSYSIVTITINNVKVFDHTHATVQMSLGEIGV